MSDAWPAVCLVGVQDYEFMQRRLELLEEGLLRGERAVLEGRTHSQSEARGLAEREASRESGKYVNKAKSLAALDAILERRRNLE